MVVHTTSLLDRASFNSTLGRSFGNGGQVGRERRRHFNTLPWSSGGGRSDGDVGSGDSSQRFAVFKLQKHFFGRTPSPLQITFLRSGKMHFDSIHKPPFCFVKHLNDGWGTRHAFASQFNDQFFKFFNQRQCAFVQTARYRYWQSFHGDEMLSRRRVNQD
jgi:hypothetical protein